MKLALSYLSFAVVLQYKQTSACNEWCFQANKCYPPQAGACTDCLKIYCGDDFAEPFQNNFGSTCIFKAMKSQSKCKAECGGVKVAKLKKRRKKCNDCLNPCIQEALNNTENFCYQNLPPPPEDQSQIQGSLPNLIQKMNVGKGEDHNQIPPSLPCELCYGNDSCPTLEELQSFSPFCLGYVALKCKTFYQHITGGTHANITSAMAWECIENSWNDPCSECPYLDPSRLSNCQTCLTHCIDAMACAYQCFYNRGMYPMAIPCDKCAALCRELSATPEEEATCMTEKCPDCAECDQCYTICEADGFAYNHCKCMY